MTDVGQMKASSEQSLMPMHPLTLFATKVVIVAAAIVLTVYVLIQLISSEIDDRMASLQIGGRAFWHKVEDNLARLADPRTMEPAKRDMLLRQVRSASANWAPFIFAIQDGAAEAQSKSSEVSPKKP